MNVSKLEYTSERQFLFRHDTNWHVQNEYLWLECNEDNIDSNSSVMYYMCMNVPYSYLSRSYLLLQETLIHGENERQPGDARSIEVFYLFYLTTRNSTKLFALQAY